MKETFEIMKQMKKEKHSENYTENVRIIEESGIAHIKKETAILFRNDGYPKADFYPHTGRWKYGYSMCRGGASMFLKWYEYRKTNVDSN